MHALTVRREEAGDAGRRGAAPGPVIPEVGPDPTLLHALSQSLEPPGAIEHPHRDVVCINAVGGHHVGPDPRHQWGEHPHALAKPVDERRGRDFRAHAREDLVLSVEMR